MPPRARLLAAAVCVAAGACVDMSAPSGSPAAISVVQAPALFVVKGQQMLDSNGAPAPLSVIAYDVHGDTTSGFTPRFFITDTTHLATIGPDNIMVGVDTGLVHVIGQIGNVQTPPLAIYVTQAPDSLTSGLAPGDTLSATGGSDTTRARGTAAASVRVLAADGTTPVGGVRVQFSIAYAPATQASADVVPIYLAGDDGKRSALDTANTAGTASRNVVVLSRFLADSALQRGSTTDSVVVLAQATYRGQPLAGSPVRLVIPLKVHF